MSKTEFIVEISHELRTPLMIIRNSLDLLSDSIISQRDKKSYSLLEIAQRNTYYMAEIISCLLDFTKIETKRYIVKKRKIYFRKFIKEIIKEFDFLARDKNIKIVEDISKDLNEVSIDPVLMKQIIVNLLSNALRFTSKEIKIEGILIKDSKRNKMRISVIDDGIGIPHAYIEKIFDKFFRISDTSGQYADFYKGLGFGLYVTKKKVELLGGKIWVESKFGKGTKFVFIIPV